MNIRLAQRSDIADLVKFNRNMALETEGLELDAEKLTKGVTAVFDRPENGFYVVTEIDGEIIGGLMVTYEWSDWRNARQWWIQSVFIKPTYRGRSLYTKMYDFVKKLAEADGNVCGFRLYVEENNVKAQAVYEKVGMSRSHYLMYEEQK